MALKGTPANILARKVNRYLRLKAEITERYAWLDKLEEEILGEMEPGQTAGKGILVDNYAEKNTCWRSHPIKRYELKVVGE